MEQIKNIDGGLQFVSQIAVDQQIIYLDFDGEITVYRNDDLDILLDVEVENSGMTEEQKSYILAELSAKYAAENIVFTIEKPKENTEYSTVFIGKTDDFEKYGSFTGLAETIDKGNQVKNDNAFVLVDFNPDIDTVISVIDHEIGHIVEGMEHDISIGSLEDYAQISTHQVLAEDGDYTFSGSSFLRYSSSSGSNFKQHAFTVSAPFYQDVKVTIKCTNIVCNQFTSGNMVVLFSDGSEYKLYDTTSAAAICSRTFSGIFEFAIGCNGSGNTSPLYIESYFTVSVDFLDCIAPVITDFYVSDYSYETATVRINATDSESNISKYYVQYGYINWAGIYVVEEASSSDGIIKLTDLNPNQTYYFFVAAEDENGNKSNFNSAGQKTFTTLADFEAPVFTGGLSYGSTGNNITLRWNAATDNASVAQYEINFNGTTYESTINSLTLNITPGVYNYSVTALDKSGNRSVTQTGSTKTVTVTGNITGSGTLTGAGTYFSGTQITVAATPDTHQLFVSLTVDGQDITGKTAG